jgi:hypothetical protein
LLRNILDLINKYLVYHLMCQDFKIVNVINRRFDLEVMDTYYTPDRPIENPVEDYPLESCIFPGDPSISEGRESPDYGFFYTDSGDHFDSFDGEDYLLI